MQPSSHAAEPSLDLRSDAAWSDSLPLKALALAICTVPEHRQDMELPMAPIAQKCHLPPHPFPTRRLPSKCRSRHYGAGWSKPGRFSRISRISSSRHHPSLRLACHSRCTNRARRSSGAEPFEQIQPSQMPSMPLTPANP